MKTGPIIFKNLIIGSFATIFGVMIPVYLALCILFSALGFGNGDFDLPLAIILVPAVAAIFSGFAFVAGVLPFAFLGKWIGNRPGMSATSGKLLAVTCSTAVGGAFGCISLDWQSPLFYSLFFGISAFAFWRFVIHADVKPLHG